MFKRRRDRTAERARCSSWVVGARKGKAASIGGLFHTKPAMKPNLSDTPTLSTNVGYWGKSGTVSNIPKPT
jgi:hypothetical protein